MECSQKVYPSESHRKQQSIPGQGMIDLDEYRGVDNPPVTCPIVRGDKQELTLEDFLKQISPKLETCFQVIRGIMDDIQRMKTLVSPDADRVPCITHIGPRSVRNRGGRPRGHSTCGNRSPRRTDHGSGMDNAGEVPPGQSQSHDLLRDSLAPPSQPVLPGTIFLLYFLIGVARPMSGIQHLRATILAIVFMQLIRRGNLAVRLQSLRWNGRTSQTG
jgi:hypothetical protein